LIKANKDTEAGILPSEQLLADMGRFNEELVKAGVMLAGEGLQPSSKGAKVRFTGPGQSTDIDGPFAETKEIVFGFWMGECSSLAEAIEWVKRCPSPYEGAGANQGEIEIRPVYEMEDLGDNFTPELREKESKLREKIENQTKH